jgi:predicted dehydrogenase
VIRVGLIGLGHWGPNIARSMQQTGRAEVRWICDLDAGRLERAANQYPEVKTTSDVGDILADGEVDAVAVSTPVHTHFELTSRALEAGKHVLVEKPITGNSDDARKLVDLAAQRERVLMVGHVFEYNASIRALKDLVDAGELGGVQYMSFTRTNLGPVRTDVNALWDLRAGTPGSTRASRTRSSRPSASRAASWRT